MNHHPAIIKHIKVLAGLLKQPTGAFDPSTLGSEFTKAITEIVPLLPEIKTELITLSELPDEVWVGILKVIETDVEILLLISVTRQVFKLLIKLLPNVNKADLAKDIQNTFYCILIIIADQNKCNVYMQSPAHYQVVNPDEDYWFKRIDTAGNHQFNTVDKNYLVNSIPKVTVADTYYNSEIYNSPYTTLLPQNVMANTSQLEIISDSIELGNFIYDLFISVPYAATHNVVFKANIRVENLLGGSRGWGFWNTNAVPVLGMKAAWFLQQNGDVADPRNNGFFVQVFNGFEYNHVRLGLPLDELPHEYMIILNSHFVKFFIDGTEVANFDQKDAVPNGPMAFHNWVDNAVFDFYEPVNRINRLGKKHLQTTSGTRKNITATMAIYTI
ncbi:hypothetical protein ACLI1A_18290 [Flavobacterium sp. RHBU_3]|uniref:hypothetical protein n=1 Tax=Flavobacterium sp. RHBU_3 TaxID=3391184 RepID=UPI003984C423